MKAETPNINVTIYIPAPHDSGLALYSHTLGTITPDQASVLQNLQGSSLSCICSIVTIRNHETAWCDKFSAPNNDLRITHLFWKNPKRPLCCNRNQTKDHLALTKMCVRNIINGKCRDEFIKTIFTNNYNKQK